MIGSSYPKGVSTHTLRTIGLNESEPPARSWREGDFHSVLLTKELPDSSAMVVGCWKPKGEHHFRRLGYWVLDLVLPRHRQQSLD